MNNIENEIQNHCYKIITTGHINHNMLKQHISKDNTTQDFFNSIKNSNSNLYCQYLAKYAVNNLIDFQGTEDNFDLKIQNTFKHSAKAIDELNSAFISIYIENIRKESVKNKDKIFFPITEESTYNNEYLNFSFKKQLAHIHQHFLSPDKLEIFIESIAQDNLKPENNNINEICYKIHSLFFNSLDENDLLKKLMIENFGKVLLDENGNLDNTKRSEMLDKVLNRTLEFFKEELPKKIKTKVAKKEHEKHIINIHNKAIVLMGYIGQEKNNTIDLTQVDKISQSMIEIINKDIKTKIDNYTKNIKNIGDIIEKKVKPFIDIKENLKQVSIQSNYYIVFDAFKQNNLKHLAINTEKTLIENTLNSQKTLKIKRKTL